MYLPGGSQRVVNIFNAEVNQIPDIRINHHGIIRVVYNEAGLGTVWLFHMLFFHIVDLDFLCIPVLGVICG